MNSAKDEWPVSQDVAGVHVPEDLVYPCIKSRGSSTQNCERT